MVKNTRGMNDLFSMLYEQITPTSILLLLFFYTDFYWKSPLFALH